MKELENCAGSGAKHEFIVDKTEPHIGLFTISLDGTITKNQASFHNIMSITPLPNKGVQNFSFKIISIGSRNIFVGIATKVVKGLVNAYSSS